jgi:Uma2 family endonuclease
MLSIISPNEVTLMAFPSHQPHLYTAEEFAAMQRDNMRAELIEGEMVAMPATFTDHGETAGNLGYLVGHFVRPKRLGKIYGAETGFLIARNPDTVRAPDFAYIATNRLPPPGIAFWGRVIPDIVGEVVSSGDRIKEIDAKVQMWLAAGVRLVWVAWPQGRIIQVYEPPAPMQELDDTMTLTGGTVLPGFTTPVSEVFG